MMEDLWGRENTAAGRYWGVREGSLGSVHLRRVKKNRQEYSDAAGKTERNSHVMKGNTHKAWRDPVQLQPQDLEVKAADWEAKGNTICWALVRAT